MTYRAFTLAQQTTTSTGTGALVLGAATTGNQTFAAAGATNGDTFWGLIELVGTAEREVTLLTYSTSGSYGTVTRATTPEFSPTAAKIDFSAGTKLVSCVGPASKTPFADDDDVSRFPGPIATKGIFETVSAPAIAAGVLTLDLLTARIFNVALDANITTLTISNMEASAAASFILEFTADGTPRTFAEPASVSAENGAYTPTSTNAKKDRLLYETINGGTRWRRWIVKQNFDA